MMDIFEGVDIEEMDDEAVIHMFMSGRTFKPSPNEGVLQLQPEVLELVLGEMKPEVVE
jgi:hypothetical protein